MLITCRDIVIRAFLIIINLFIFSLIAKQGRHNTPNDFKPRVPVVITTKKMEFGKARVIQT